MTVEPQADNDGRNSVDVWDAVLGIGCKSAGKTNCKAVKVHASFPYCPI